MMSVNGSIALLWALRASLYDVINVLVSEGFDHREAGEFACLLFVDAWS